ncbi:MAG TPA: redoxin family protein [Flavobacteriales bacterium]|nr:redoxin family protein [Flavobacteriales bacterium]
MLTGIFQSSAQLADGSTAPDFTLTDINGNTINLYSYLDAGKTVYLDMFAAHCPTCWSYHNTHALRDLYNNHGPSGSVSQDIMVIAVEHDAGNGMNELTGVSGATAGDWVTGTPYPIINPEGTDRGNFITAYDVVYYPMVYAICPDRKTTLIGTQNEATLYAHVGNCAMSGISEMTEQALQVYYSSTDNCLHISGANMPQANLTVYDVNGKLILQRTCSGEPVTFSQVETGLYFYILQTSLGSVYRGKFFH